MNRKINALLLEKRGFREESTARDVIKLCYANKPKVRLMTKNGLYYIIQVLE